MKSRLVQSLLLAGLSFAVAGAYLVWRAPRGPAPAEAPAEAPAAQRQTAAATLINDKEPLPPFRLNSPRGELTEQSLKGRWTFMFFGYTQCPDVCPGALSLMTEVARRTGPQARPGVLFVSVDPQRDTLELLGNFVPAFDPAFVGATAADAQLAPLLKHLGVFFRRNDEKDKHNYTVDHTAALFLIDPEGRLKAVFSPPHDVGSVVSDYMAITP